MIWCDLIWFDVIWYDLIRFAVINGWLMIMVNGWLLHDFIWENLLKNGTGANVAESTSPICAVILQSSKALKALCFGWILPSLQVCMVPIGKRNSMCVCQLKHIPAPAGEVMKWCQMVDAFLLSVCPSSKMRLSIRYFSVKGMAQPPASSQPLSRQLVSHVDEKVH